MYDIIYQNSEGNNKRSMKKIFFIILLFFMGVSIQAQFLRGFGIKMGTSVTSQNWEYRNFPVMDFADGSKMTISPGVFAEFFTDKNFSLLSEINYVQKGASEELQISTIENPLGTNETVKWNAVLDYLNISLLGKFRIQTGSFQPYIVAGPYLDLEIDKTNELENFNTDPNKFGIKTGIGSEIDILSIKLLLEIVYHIELDELYKTDILKITSSSYDIRIGVML